jgi:hypothetical protein
MAMQQLQGSGRDLPTEVNLRRAAKIISGDLLRRLRNTDLVDDSARLEAADRIEALEFEVEHLRDVLRTIRYGIDSECDPLQQDK